MPIQQSRVSEIAAKIRGACATILDTQDGIYIQQDALNAARDDNRSVRLSAMITVANLSRDDKWFPGEITEACKKAAKAGNAQDKSAKALSTFISEMKNCAHPNVRDQFAHMVSAVETAWDDETQAITQDDNAPTPLRNLWARAYHAVSGLARHAKEHGGQYISAHAVVEYALAHDPAFDVAKVHKRLKGLVSSLQEMFREFPHDEIKTAADFLELIKPEDLVKARELLAASTPVAGVLVPAEHETITTVVNEDDESEVMEPSAGAVVNEDDESAVMEPSAGAVDLLDDVLNEIAGGTELMAA